MKSLRIVSFLLLLSTWVAYASSVRAQISNPAFDPHCYQPVIGTPGVIDTIMGAKNGQYLGRGPINIGPSPENPDGPGRIMMYGLPGTLGDSSAGILTVGSSFDPSHLNITKMLGFKPSGPTFGHFRSKKYMDMLLMPGNGNAFYFPRIYWLQANGTYDSSSYTALIPDPRLFSSAMDGLIPPYHAHLTSDSVEDIVLLYHNITHDTTVAPDSAIVCRFFGGENLYQPRGNVYPSSRLFYDSTKNFSFSSGFLVNVGDFRGTGREDMVGSDNKGNLLFFPNDTPFTLDKFVNALKHDTLFSISSAPSWVNHYYFNYSRVTVQSRNNGPTDLVIVLDSAYLQGDWTQMRIFKGGPGFGLHPLTLDDAFPIHSPKFFDGSDFRESGWGLEPKDCGDMTGTGDHVLGVVGDFGGDASFYTFYVLGNSLDEKVDMFFEEDYGEPVIDTATLDGDKFQDVVIGAFALPDLIVSGMQHRGSVLFVHGSTKIPTADRAVRMTAASSSHLQVFQSADRRSITVTLPEDVAYPGWCRFQLHDILGRTVFQADGLGEEVMRLSIPDVPIGTYILEVQAGEKVFEVKLLL